MPKSTPRRRRSSKESNIWPVFTPERAQEIATETIQRAAVESARAHVILGISAVVSKKGGVNLRTLRAISEADFPAALEEARKNAASRHNKVDLDAMIRGAERRLKRLRKRKATRDAKAKAKATKPAKGKPAAKATKKATKK